MTWAPKTYEEGLRMAWDDDDDDGVAHCLSYIEPHLPSAGVVVDIGCGVGRLAIPIAERHPELLVFGVDTSSAMLAVAPIDAPVSWQGHMPPGFDFAYSVLTFQHIGDDEMRRYLQTVRDAGADILFQFVEGTEREPLSMQRPSGWVREWCHAAGFSVVALETDRRFDNWRWVYAR